MIGREVCRAIEVARSLKTEPGDSNPEYDRALVEMTIRLAGLDDDHRDQVAEWIGVNR